MVYPRYKFCLEIWRRSRCVAWNRELPSQRKGRKGTGKGGKEKERKEKQRKGVIRISLYSSKAGAVGVPESNPLSVQKIKGSTRTSVAELLTFGARKSFLEIHGALSLTSPAFPFFCFKHNASKSAHVSGIYVIIIVFLPYRFAWKSTQGHVSTKCQYPLSTLPQVDLPVLSCINFPYVLAQSAMFHA